MDARAVSTFLARAAEATHGHSTVASVIPAWMSLPHQINATFLSALAPTVMFWLRK